MNLRVAETAAFGFKLVPVAVAVFVAASWAPRAHGGSSLLFLIGLNTGIHDGPQTAMAAHLVSANSVRIDAPWRDIEHVKGQYEIPDWLQKRVSSAISLNMTPLVILEYGNPLYGGGKPLTAASRLAFARYAEFVVKSFRGQVRLFELWNEWAGNAGNTRPASAWAYISLARIAYPAIKRANAQAVVLSGGIFDLTHGDERWFREFLAFGGLRFVDALSVHPYDFQRGSDGTPYLEILQVEHMHTLAMTANGGRAVDVYVSEMGYPDNTGLGGHASEVVAAYLERFMLLAAAHPWVRGVWWYGLRNQGTNRSDPESNFGLYGFNFEQKPQARAFARVATFLRSVSALSLTATGARSPQTFEATCSAGKRVTIELPADPASAPDLPKCEE